MALQIFQGIGAVIPSQQVLKANGTPATGIFTGTEPLVGAVWPGGAFQAPTFAFAPIWSAVGGGPAGLIDLVFTAAESAMAWPGQYTVQVRLTDFSVELFSQPLTILATPAATTGIGGTFTRALADLGLLQRLSLVLGRAKIAIDATSPISQFNDPLARALSYMKVSLSNPIQPGDTDIAALRPNQWRELMDIAEVEVLVWATTASTFVGLGITDERWPDYSYRRDPQQLMYIQSAAKEKINYVKMMYGYGVAPLLVSSINLGFQAWPGDATDSLSTADIG